VPVEIYLLIPSETVKSFLDPLSRAALALRAAPSHLPFLVGPFPDTATLVLE